MSGPPSKLLLIVLIVGYPILLGVVSYLLHRLCRLARAQRVVRDELARFQHDMAGLCAAAVGSDQRLSHNEARLAGLSERIDQVERNGELKQAYQVALERVKRGAGTEELVRECGLAQEEALLLIRLYGLGNSAESRGS